MNGQYSMSCHKGNTDEILEFSHYDWDEELEGSAKRSTIQVSMEDFFADLPMFQLMAD